MTYTEIMKRGIYLPMLLKNIHLFIYNNCYMHELKSISVAKSHAFLVTTKYLPQSVLCTRKRVSIGSSRYLGHAHYSKKKLGRTLWASLFLSIYKMEGSQFVMPPIIGWARIISPTCRPSLFLLLFTLVLRC